MARPEEDAAEKLKYDLFYIKNHNLLLDMLILIETVEVVLFHGARVDGAVRPRAFGHSNQYTSASVVGVG